MESVIKVEREQEEKKSNKTQKLEHSATTTKEKKEENYIEKANANKNIEPRGKGRRSSLF